MADPTPYVVSYSFSGFQASSPAAPLPAASVDNEFTNIETTLSETIAAVADVRRADGNLKNGSVGPDQLSPALTNNWRPRGEWSNDSVEYYAGDGVFHDGYFYVSRLFHTSSGATEPSIDPVTWLVQFALATAVGNMLVSVYDPNFRELDVFDTDSHQDGTTNKVFTALEKTKLANMEAGATATPYTPAGSILAYAGASAPSGWLLCYGQAVSRTTYADLFTALSTTYGVGDGSTTFNLPDLRGRSLSGKDNMGGSAASRLTTGGSGVDGATLGAVGGSETHTLTTAQLASHTHSFTGDATGAGGAHTHPVGGATDSAGSNATQRFVFGGSANTDTVSTSGISATHTHTTSGTNAPAGSGAAHNNVQPTLVCNYIIKT
ncbi:tail fiber protein [Hoeflea sp. G2-23]|uniref:Tail fiber protein n=1 Tax=Hoeflea algicola TaxID=2983763 RepID=A0ABT3Z962_9HYPH|nr:tail fiber protein [Hoeflea algicola]MCY0148320.1 tail fiber protein [Hoeflea algicola]